MGKKVSLLEKGFHDRFSFSAFLKGKKTMDILILLVCFGAISFGIYLWREGMKNA
jgi:hypothetical protein